MFSKAKGWFGGLTKAGKVTAFVATAMVGGIMASAMAQPPKNTPTPTPAPALITPEIITKVETQTEAIPFESVTENDASRNAGETFLSTAGVNGVRTIKYEVTYKDGNEDSRKQISSIVTTEPVTQITKLGTYVRPTSPPPPAASSSCDPNYSGACVPIASDVDCAGGSGNGPAYVSGPVYVIGYDKYDLDRDGDGVGCE